MHARTCRTHTRTLKTYTQEHTYARKLSGTHALNFYSISRMVSRIYLVGWLRRIPVPRSVWPPALLLVSTNQGIWAIANAIRFNFASLFYLRGCELWTSSFVNILVCEDPRFVISSYSVNNFQQYIITVLQNARGQFCIASFLCYDEVTFVSILCMLATEIFIR